MPANAASKARKPRLERGARIDVAGRAEALGDRGERHALGVELAVDERETRSWLLAACVAGSGSARRRWRRASGADAGAGAARRAAAAGRSGPLMPQPAAHAATSATATRAAGERPDGAIGRVEIT